MAGSRARVKPSALLATTELEPLGLNRASVKPSVAGLVRGCPIAWP